MSNDMQIEIVNVSVSTIPTAKGSYQVADVAYKNKTFQDKLEGKKLMSFAQKDVYGILSQAKFGEVYTVSRSKNEKGFWDWVAVQQGSTGAPAAAPATAGGPAVRAATPSPKSTYETPEERAARQVMIVRQSSISNAVAMVAASGDKKAANPETIVAIARQFEDYVFGKDNALVEPEAPPRADFSDMDDDLPL